MSPIQVFETYDCDKRIYESFASNDYDDFIHKITINVIYKKQTTTTATTCTPNFTVFTTTVQLNKTEAKGTNTYYRYVRLNLTIYYYFNVYSY